MKSPASLRQQLPVWGLILGLWCLLVLASASQLVFVGLMTWDQAFVASLHDWLPWALLAPAVAWFASLFPLERGRLLVSVPLHVVACIFALVVCEWLARPLPPPPGLPHTSMQPPQVGGPAPPIGEPEQRRAGEFPPPARRAPGLGGPRPFGPRGLLLAARFNIPMYWIIVTVVQALTYYRRSQDRERATIELEARLAQARLQALRMQLHPHFLFNTLNAISTLVHKNPKAADEMIGNLSELLRVALDTSDQEQVSLRQELDFLNRYLEIQQTRFGERLRVTRQIDLAALEAQVPALILQPLVENAIRHGIEPNAGPGTIAVVAQREAEKLHLTVKDSGAGAMEAKDHQPGIGLANTRARLQELYGAEARLLLNTAAEGGWSVDVVIPFREKA